ncbi:type IV secretory system conjugative DNA transfer family protein [Tardiphaga sp. P9-11]|nr:type IV secretory system conjugative DNA transfer family protein [Tardiphaga sp. P9-11]
MPIIWLLFKVLWFIIRWTWRLAFWLLKRVARVSRTARPNGAHGTARFATFLELIWRKALSGAGPVIGKTSWDRLVRFTKDGIVMVFAATGAGKGLGVVIPTLLDYPGSILVTDPKGENYAVTHRHRGRVGKVRMLNPTDLSRSERFNPMDMIRIGTSLETDDATALAKLMVRPDAREAHWDDKAISLLTALILHVLHEPPETRTLSSVRSISVGAPETFFETLSEISQTSRSLHAAEIAAGFLSQASTSYGDATPEFKSILSNVHKATEQWSAGSPAGQLAAYSTFSLDELIDDVTTLYLCVDEELLATYERWLRVMTGCVLNALTRGKTRPRPRHKVLLLLDEVAVLGALEPLERQSGLLRAYCTPVLIWQNLPQVMAVYGARAAAFLANASCRVFFGVNDNETATYVANMLGHTTSFSQSHGTSHSSDAWLRHHEQQGETESGYWLLDPSEVQRLPVTQLVAKFRDIPFPVRLSRIDYRNRPGWWGRWDKWRPTLVSAHLTGDRQAPDQRPQLTDPASGTVPSDGSGRLPFPHVNQPGHSPAAR